MRMTVAKRWFTVLFAALFILSPTVSLASEAIPPPDEVGYIDPDGEIFRLEVGKDMRHCIADSSSPLCQVEMHLQSHFPESGSQESDWLINGIVKWIFGVGEGADGDQAYPARGSVVQPVLIDYQIVAVKTLDEFDIERLRSHWGEMSPVDWLKPGAVQVEALVAFEDAHQMRWPADGWQRHHYLLDEAGNSGNSLVTEEGPSSRTIGRDQATSECIGRPDTPLCAVETLLACRARRDEALCELVDDTHGDNLNWPTNLSYLVAAIDAVDDEKLPPGHKYAVTLEEFYAGTDTRYDDADFTRYVLLHSGTSWRVVERELITWEIPQAPQ